MRDGSRGNPRNRRGVPTRVPTPFRRARIAVAGSAVSTRARAGRDLAAADEPASFALWLAELIELTGADRIAVAVEGGALVVTNEAGEHRLVIEPR